MKITIISKLKEAINEENDLLEDAYEALNKLCGDICMI